MNIEEIIVPIASNKQVPATDLFKTLFTIKSGFQPYETTIRMSLAHFDKKKNRIVKGGWMINHVSRSKIWDRLVFIGINPDTNDSFIGWMSKQDFFSALGVVDKKNRSIYFSIQQSGYSGNNDDYMSSGKKLRRLIEDGYLKDISTW